MASTILHNEPMFKHTSWRVGGGADTYFMPESVEDLSTFLKNKPEGEPIFWIGMGSNVLVRDGGIRGTVIACAGKLNSMKLTDKNTIRSEIGVSCAKLSRFAGKNNLSGLEFLSGIPGTLGGALAMNAGAFGGETWGHVSRVITIDEYGELRNRTKGDYKISYRDVSLRSGNQEWFIAAEFVLNGRKSDASIKELLEKRNSSQPIGLASCGSVFKNPQGGHAAKLIERSGLKGFCIGKACVSEKHANFIVNTGGAKAREIEDLIKYVQGKVEQEHGVLLEPEVRIVGQES